jgi:tetratricopeptide (TPR) repeat protein
MNAIGRYCVAVAFWSAAFCCGGFAETVKDSFGQNIESNLDQSVTRARLMRFKGEADYDLDKSISILSEITKEQPEYYRAWFNYALALYSKDGKVTVRVEKAFETAIEIRAKYKILDGSIFNSVGWAYLNQQNYNRAEKFLLEGVKLEAINKKSTNGALFYNLGKLYFEIGELAKATPYLSKALAYNNTSAKDLLEIISKVERKIP